MPITKQTIKRVRQAKVKTARNRHYKSHMKSMIKLALDYIKEKNTDKANKILPKVFSAIDKCAKGDRNIIHKKNAARKKARIQRNLNAISGAKEAPKAEKKAPEKKATAAK